MNISYHEEKSYILINITLNKLPHCLSQAWMKRGRGEKTWLRKKWAGMVAPSAKIINENEYKIHRHYKNNIYYNLLPLP